ncbi:hypothetical protein E2C01_008914 [Portunus trituberculatus]|uniref:Uncharacterized protein n=1 Tax=Portunus trituberculatus TaxID=210409 RepID=A0A5B7D373_PORTR|nr:hypothetical protein [Portunus trituberculatus]
MKRCKDALRWQRGRRGRPRNAMQKLRKNRYHGAAEALLAVSPKSTSFHFPGDLNVSYLFLRSIKGAQRAIWDNKSGLYWRHFGEPVKEPI